MPIEQLSPELTSIVSTEAKIEILGTGYGFIGDPFHGAGPAEGPIWYKDGEYLLFNDIGHNRTLKWSDKEGVTLVREPTNNANGLTRDLQGRLIACEHTSRKVTRQEPSGTTTIIASHYRNKKLNRPNDVIVKSDGAIYFTDPGAPHPDLDLDFSGVYKVEPESGAITLLVQDFVVPNGLAFSLNEDLLYISDTARSHIREFAMQPDGTLDLNTDKVFCELTGNLPGVPDGMKLDTSGNLYCTGPGGVWVINPLGKHIGTIVIGEGIIPTNMAWGGNRLETLFITCWHELARVQMNISGLPVPQIY